MKGNGRSRFGLNLGELLADALKGAGLTLQGPIIRKRKGLDGYKPNGPAPRPWLRGKRDRRFPEENTK